jgi:hypothetical protein
MTAPLAWQLGTLRRAVVEQRRALELAPGRAAARHLLALARAANRE